MSKVLQGPKTWYQAIEKDALAVVFTAQRLRHYFQSFIVIMVTGLAIRKVFQKLNIASEPRELIKGQIYADLLVELSSDDTQLDPNDFQWVISVDGSSNQQGSGVRVILE